MDKHLQHYAPITRCILCIAAIEMIETENDVRTRASRGFSHHLCLNQLLGCYRPFSMVQGFYMILSIYANWNLVKNSVKRCHRETFYVITP
jgi:hypothetical protein